MSGAVVIGVGNRYRRDDGAGPAVLDALAADPTAARARLLELDGEPARVVEAWAGADLAIVVDALCSDDPPPARYGESRSARMPASSAIRRLPPPAATRWASARLPPWAVRSGGCPAGSSYSRSKERTSATVKDCRHRFGAR